MCSKYFRCFHGGLNLKVVVKPGLNVFQAKKNWIVGEKSMIHSALHSSVYSEICWGLGNVEMNAEASINLLDES